MTLENIDIFFWNTNDTLISFLAVTWQLYGFPCHSLTHSLTHWLTVLNLEPSRLNQTKPTWPTYPTGFPDPPELPSHLTYPSTWPTHPSVQPIYLIYSPTQITSQNWQITSLTPQITSLKPHITSLNPQTTSLNLKITFHSHLNFEKITILTKFHISDQISQSWLYFTI